MNKVVLKHKAISGFQWSFAGNLLNQGSNFLIGILLARLLSPKEFGLIGMLTFFVAVSQVFVDSGFGEALIRKKDEKEKDYSTVFYFNMAVGFIFYLILFFCAGFVGRFFNEPKLVSLLRVLSVVLIINSLGMVQLAILKKQLNFKLQAKISFISAACSGIVAIEMACAGWGVWSLVWKVILYYSLSSLLLWVWNSWRPRLLFSPASFKDLFNFGSKLLVAGLLEKIYTNIYPMVIGKYFSAESLGYYTYAYNFSNFPAQNISGVIQQVSYPLFASIQDDLERFKRGYVKVLKNTMFISFILMAGIAASAEPLVLVLLGEKWLPTVPYLRLLCFVGMIYPLHSLNLNVLKIKGRSDLFLRIDVIKRVLVIPVIAVGVIWGIKSMILGMIIFSGVVYFLNSYWTGRLINYPAVEQLRDMAPLFISSIVMGLVLFGVGYFSRFSSFVILGMQVLISIACAISIAKIARLDIYDESRRIISLKIKDIQSYITGSGA